MSTCQSSRAVDKANGHDDSRRRSIHNKGQWACALPCFPATGRCVFNAFAWRHVRYGVWSIDEIAATYWILFVAYRSIVYCSRDQASCFNSTVSSMVFTSPYWRRRDSGENNGATGRPSRPPPSRWGLEFFPDSVLYSSLFTENGSNYSVYSCSFLGMEVTLQIQVSPEMQCVLAHKLRNWLKPEYLRLDYAQKLTWSLQNSTKKWTELDWRWSEMRKKH